jgi:excinuclease ABC subunit C
MDENIKSLTSLDKGAMLIKSLASSLPDSPGVYRMLNNEGDVLYVGKAKSLKKRVMSYTNYKRLSLRIQRMVSETKDMVFVFTHTEVEALLLESNLIKKLSPRYNVLLRDDKSFPYIMLTGDHDYPLLKKHRGAQKQKGDYFGPFANGKAVNDTLILLQKVFLLRNCTDNVFASRKRPCLQYHIKRCTAPCVDLISEEGYAEQVKQAKDFLSGKSREIQEDLIEKMKTASDNLDYEQAASYRDRIKVLGSIQAHQDINTKNLKDADVIAATQKQGKTCIMVFFFRAGQNFGNKAYYPRHSKEDKIEDILGAFLAQFYENKPCPPQIYVNVVPSDRGLLEQALSSKTEGLYSCKIIKPSRGAKLRLVDFTQKNAEETLSRELLIQSDHKKLLRQLAKTIGLDKLPERIEIYDNSHTSGKNMVGTLVVAGKEGFIKSAYRKFNIKKAAAADDYEMMREVLYRRFKKAIKAHKRSEDSNWPDLIIIDGGKGQLNAVYEVLKELEIARLVKLISIAKGKDRNAGNETIYLLDQPPIKLKNNDPVLHYLQRLRDEAHRFAIGTHRARRSKTINKSVLDEIEGIGPKRKKALLLYFGSAKEVEKAGIQDLLQVEGISLSTAEKIYYFFHET